MHESTRVYCDKLINEKDIDSFQKILSETVKKGFEVCIVAFFYHQIISTFHIFQ